MSTSVPTWKAFDTTPPLTGVMYNAGVPVDLSPATTVKAICKGATVLITGTCTKATVVTPTATVTQGSASLSTVSSLASILAGSSIQGNGIPAYARVGSINTLTNVITMVDADNNPLSATAGGSGVTLTINVGTVFYAWKGATPGPADLSVAGTYQEEYEVTWNDGTISTFPNDSYSTFKVIADLEGA